MSQIFWLILVEPFQPVVAAQPDSPAAMAIKELAVKLVEI